MLFFLFDLTNRDIIIAIKIETFLIQISVKFHRLLSMIFFIIILII